MNYKWIYISTILLCLNGCITNVISQNTQVEQNQNTRNTNGSPPSSTASDQVNLNGFWEDGAGVLIELKQVGTTLTATYPDKRGSFTGQLKTTTVIDMDFSSLTSKCCTGEVKEDLIEWSDHTSWRKKN